MAKTYIEAQKFEKLHATLNPLIIGTYEACNFQNCSFANANLAHIHFIDCTFQNCDFSMATVKGTAFQDIKFKDCKLLGVHFEHSNPMLLGVYFENCLLNLASFYQLKLKKTTFRNCSLQEVDFTETDLSNALFDGCDLAGATFENTNLEKADLRKAHHYTIHPDQNRIKKAKFSIGGIAGLLAHYDIEIEL